MCVCACVEGGCGGIDEQEVFDVSPSAKRSVLRSSNSGSDVRVVL